MEDSAACAASVRAASSREETLACWMSAVDRGREIRVSDSIQGECEKEATNDKV